MMSASTVACINIPANARISQPMSERLSCHFLVPISMAPSIPLDASAAEEVYTQVGHEGAAGTVWSALYWRTTDENGSIAESGARNFAVRERFGARDGVLSGRARAAEDRRIPRRPRRRVSGRRGAERASSFRRGSHVTGRNVSGARHDR